jgi:hypothetical protein
MKSLSLVVLISLFSPQAWADAAGGGQTAPVTRQTIDVSRLGPQVGETVPDFNLPDQEGRSRNLRSLSGPRGTMLVFLRSADW